MLYISKQMATLLIQLSSNGIQLHNNGIENIFCRLYFRYHVYQSSPTSPQQVMLGFMRLKVWLGVSRAPELQRAGKMYPDF